MEEMLYLGQTHDFDSQYGWKKCNFEDMSEEELKKYRDQREKDLIMYGEETLDMLADFSKMALELLVRGIPQDRISNAALAFNDFQKLFVTSDYRILLPGFNNAEIILAPKTKALYFLFLRHKDGLFRKDLFRLGEEVTIIYQAITHSKELSSPKKRTIEKLISKTDSQSFDDSCAEIKREFLKHFSKYTASYYYISGEKDQLRGISLPRCYLFVEWEK